MSDAIRPIVMPKWGLAMQEGMVAKWLVEEGAEIEAGDEILDIETSKIANVFESPVAGPLRRRRGRRGRDRAGRRAPGRGRRCLGPGCRPRRLHRRVPGGVRRPCGRGGRGGAAARDRRGGRPAHPLSGARRGRRRADRVHSRLRRRSQQLAVQPGGPRRGPGHLCVGSAGPWRLDQGSGRRPCPRRRARWRRGRLHGCQGHRQGASGRPFARRRDRVGPGLEPRRSGRLGHGHLLGRPRARDQHGLHRRLHGGQAPQAAAAGARDAGRRSRRWSRAR